MRGEQLELEFLAREVRKRAGLADDGTEYASVIAERLLGEDGVCVDEQLVGPAYLRRREDGGYQIVVRPSVPDIRFAIAHELGHYAVREIAKAVMDPIAEERAANYVGAAILAPATALRRLHCRLGNALSALMPIAEYFGMSQTSTHLRLAEVLGDDRALVTANNNNVLTRGSRWGNVPVVSVARGRVTRRDVVKAVLRGGIDEGRVALRLR